MSFKQCVVCGETKELSTDNFYLSKNHGPDGFSDTCKCCNIEKTKSFEGVITRSSPLYNPDSGRQSIKQKIALEANRKRTIGLLLNKGLKQCSCCLDIKPVAEFNKDKKTYTGYSSRCKPCSNKAAAESRKNKKSKGTDHEQQQQ